MNALKWFVAANVFLSRRMDAMLWPGMSIDGNTDFATMLRARIGDDLVVVDVGSGKTPFYSPEDVREKRLSVVGIDIDRDELDAAPLGAYEKAICADICTFMGDGCADVVIVRSVLEHVVDNRSGMRGIASLCKAGGQVSTFCPNRRAWFALVNRLMPEAWKRTILYTIYPQTRRDQGFPAYYDLCTPRQMAANMESAGLKVERIDPYFVSSYFMFFFPLHALWRLINVPLMKISPLAFCETFAMHAIKHADDRVVANHKMTSS